MKSKIIRWGLILLVLFASIGCPCCGPKAKDKKLESKKDQNKKITKTVPKKIEKAITPKTNKNNKKKRVSFKLWDLNQNTFVTPRDYTGKILILNFFASWCPPCQKEIPHFNAYQKEVSSQKKNIQTVGVLLDDNIRVAKNYVASKKFEYPVYLPDEKMKKGKNLEVPGIGKIKGIPLTAIIDKKGEVKKVIIGLLTKERLEKIVHNVLNNSSFNSNAQKKKTEGLTTIKLKVAGMMRAKGAT